MKFKKPPTNLLAEAWGDGPFSILRKMSIQAETYYQPAEECKHFYSAFVSSSTPPIPEVSMAISGTALMSATHVGAWNVTSGGFQNKSANLAI